MSDLDALLAGIVADPHNEVRWLVIADWLDEHDQPERAELLRVHRELLRTCTLGKETKARKQLHNRMMDLLRAGVQPCVPQQTMELPGGVKMAFSFIPPGSFLMGSDKGENREKPVHEVRLTQGFWMGTTPVTQEQWQAVMGNNPSNFNGPLLPVETVSWEDAAEFCRQVRQHCEIGLRLPTEAEWEYACRAGTTTKYFCGNGEEVLEQFGWFGANASRTTQAVGQMLPNAWGLQDMYGNVLEWCEDWYDAAFYGHGPTNDPVRSDSGHVYKILRGGCWINNAYNCRSTFRSYFESTFRAFGCGFRVCSSCT